MAFNILEIDVNKSLTSHILFVLFKKTFVALLMKDPI